MKKISKYLLIFWISFITLGIMMGATRHIYTHGRNIKGAPKSIIEFLSSYISIIFHYGEESNPMLTSIEKGQHLKDGFNYTTFYKGSNDYILESAYGKKEKQSIVRLIRIRDGKTLHTWVPDIDFLNKKYNEILFFDSKNQMNKKNTQIINPILTNDGSIIYGGTGFYKIDKHSKIVWENVYRSHHSNEMDENGDFWICGYNTNKTIARKFLLKDDAIQKIDGKSGNIIFQKSIYEILKENGYERGSIFVNPIITGNSKYYDYFHLNDIQPVTKDSKHFKKGDLFISLRQLNLVLLYRPSTSKILWKRTGDWLNQHDIEILDDNRIAIFGNNITNGKFHIVSKNLIDGHNIEYIYDFEKDTITTPFETLFKGANIGTFTEGRARILNNNEIFIEETNQGRLLYGNTKHLLWTYVNKTDENHFSQFNWCRYITEDEFKKFTFVSKK